MPFSRKSGSACFLDARLGGGTLGTVAWAAIARVGSGPGTEIAGLEAVKAFGSSSGTAMAGSTSGAGVGETTTGAWAGVRAYTGNGLFGSGGFPGQRASNASAPAATPAYTHR